MSELKPCPFCGGTPRINYNREGNPVGVHCKCGAYVRFLFMPRIIGETSGDVQDRIAARWNARVPHQGD